MNEQEKELIKRLFDSYADDCEHIIFNEWIFCSEEEKMRIIRDLQTAVMFSDKYGLN
jgi:hypothetical protein